MSFVPIAMLNHAVFMILSASLRSVYVVVRPTCSECIHPFNSSCLTSVRECLSTSRSISLILSASISSFISLPSSVQLVVSHTSLPVQKTETSLKCNDSVPGCALAVRGSMVTSIFMPLLRAFGGRRARKLRAVLPERGLNGEKVVLTVVRNRVIIFTVCGLISS